jgi:hypothetical protein
MWLVEVPAALVPSPKVKLEETIEPSGSEELEFNATASGAYPEVVLALMLTVGG